MKRLLALLCLIMFVGNLPVHAAENQPPSGPAEVVQEFYHWYLDELTKNNDPIQDHVDILGNYVSEYLIKEIKKKQQSQWA